MSLQRTPSGLANLHLFFKVQRVVYCEGGSPLSEQDVFQGGGNSETLDVCYWQSVFRVFGSNNSCHFKSVGSKSLLRSIALSVSNNNIGSVTVCFDSDHDTVLGRNLNGAHVLYTRGYSWENDIFADEPLESLFFRFRNRSAEGEAAYTELERSFKKFLDKAQKFCACDVYFISRSSGGLFKRDAPPSAILNIGKKTPPEFNEAFIRQRLTDFGYKRIPNTKHKVLAGDVKYRLFGKLLGKFVYYLVSHFAAPTSGSFMSYELFMRTAVMRFEDSLRAGGFPTIRAHFTATIP